MEAETQSQRAFLLGRMRDDRQHRVTAAALKKLPKAAVERLRLDSGRIGEVLAGLVEQGLVIQGPVGKSVGWRLTESGAAYVRTLPASSPLLKAVHDDGQLLDRQKAFALFHLFIARGGQLSAAELRRKLTAAKAKPLGFDARTARWVMALLVADGSVVEQRDGKSVFWQASAATPARLATLKQHPDIELTLTGEAFNALTSAGLMTAAETRGAAPEALNSPAPSASGARATAAPADLAEVVLSEFRELLREKHWHTGMVPIHEVRRRVATRNGEQAARHDVLDDRVRQLRRQERVRLISLSDLSRATPEQLADSIPGDNETFFYLGEP